MEDNIHDNEIPEFFEERDLFGQVKPTINVPEYVKTAYESSKKQAPNVRYADLGIRIGAYILDSIFLFIPCFILKKSIFDANEMSNENLLAKSLLDIIVYALYYGFTESSNAQATFGKQICGIKVIDEDGNKLTFKKAALRYLASIISVLPLGFGIWAIEGDERKQAWHDTLLGCYVIHKESEPTDTLTPPAIDNTNDDGAPTA